MKFGVYLSLEGKLVLIERHPTREDRFNFTYMFRDEVITDQPLANYFKVYMRGRYEYIGKF